MWDLIGKLIEKLNCINNTARIENLEKRVDHVENKMDYEYYTKEWVNKINDDNEKTQHQLITSLEKAVTDMSMNIKENHNVLMTKYDKSDKRITDNAIQLSSIQTAINMMNDNKPRIISKQRTWKP